MNTEESVVSEDKTKGQLFKEKFGYSKTMARNMRKAGCTTVEEYRLVRKAAKKQGPSQKPKK